MTEEPIATIEYERAGHRHRAILPNDLVWQVPTDPHMAEMLNTQFPTDPSPSRGIPGHEAATRAAVWLGGVLTFTPREPAPPGADH
jgi:hypothetical protein